jgi:hypothetical protein
MKDCEYSMNGLKILERKIYFEDDGGYVFDIHYIPSNFFWKIIHKLGLISPELPVAEIENGHMCWEYLEVIKQDRLKSKIIFKPKGRGAKTVRFVIPKDTSSKYRIRIFLDNLYN